MTDAKKGGGFDLGHVARMGLFVGRVSIAGIPAKVLLGLTIVDCKLAWDLAAFGQTEGAAVLFVANAFWAPAIPFFGMMACEGRGIEPPVKKVRSPTRPKSEAPVVARKKDPAP